MCVNKNIYETFVKKRDELKVAIEKRYTFCYNSQV